MREKPKCVAKINLNNVASSIGPILFQWMFHQGSRPIGRLLFLDNAKIETFLSDKIHENK